MQFDIHVKRRTLGHITHAPTQHRACTYALYFYTQKSEDTGYTSVELVFWTHVNHLSSISLATAGVKEDGQGYQDRSALAAQNQHKFIVVRIVFELCNVRLGGIIHVCVFSPMISALGGEIQLIIL